jgi:superfamily II DNA/RNA helicase
MLGPNLDGLEEDDEELDEQTSPVSALYPLRTSERDHLRRFLKILSANQEEDPKAREVERILLHGHEDTGPWLDLGCIVFSQYLDSVLWLASRLSERFPSELIGVYSNASSSGIYEGGYFRRLKRDDLREQVLQGKLRLVVGTDAASEGLNLQRAGSLINLDLPWNPTRLEQRKGRIQRLGQVRSEVLIYNMRYRESVEDRVHELLSERLRAIRDLFGQLPDTLEDVWVEVALHQGEKARQIIDAVPTSHPFEMRYDRVESVDFESCQRVLDDEAQLELLRQGWPSRS